MFDSNAKIARRRSGTLGVLAALALVAVGASGCTFSYDSEDGCSIGFTHDDDDDDDAKTTCSCEHDDSAPPVFVAHSNGYVAPRNAYTWNPDRR